MRKLFLLLVVVALGANAQDVIVKKDGSTILSKVTKIGTSEVEYKKFSNQNGPTYSILKSDIQAINYENGEKEMFSDATKNDQQEAKSQQQIVNAIPASDNAEIIAQYNKNYEHGEAIKDKAKTAKQGLCIMGVGENSVLSTKDITVEFRQEPYIEEFDVLGSPFYCLTHFFFVQIHNKSDKTLYVDLGSTFRVMKDGSSKVYYDNSQTTFTKGQESGASLNLGAVAGAAGIGGVIGSLANGVNVGGGNTTSTSKTYSKQRVIAIPPHGKVPIEKYERIRTKGAHSELIAEGEKLLYGYAKDMMPVLSIGEEYYYKEDTSPYHTDYTITYSYSSEFATSYVVKASIYIREMIGATFSGYWNRPWIRSYSNPQKLIEKMKERIPDYNDYTIVGAFGYAH